MELDWPTSVSCPPYLEWRPHTAWHTHHSKVPLNAFEWWVRHAVCGHHSMEGEWDTGVGQSNSIYGNSWIQYQSDSLAREAQLMNDRSECRFGHLGAKLSVCLSLSLSHTHTLRA
jgi:hypothetical protein